MAAGLGGAGEAVAEGGGSGVDEAAVWLVWPCVVAGGPPQAAIDSTASAAPHAPLVLFAVTTSKDQTIGRKDGVTKAHDLPPPCGEGQGGGPGGGHRHGKSSLWWRR